MCEMLAVRSEAPIPVERILQYAVMVEEYGVGGFNWGIAWTTGNGEVNRYRSVNGIRSDKLVNRSLAGLTATSYFVHLRRPSLMNSMSHRNAQPYLAEDRSMAFAHNGFFEHHNKVRPQYAEKLEGTSDSEIGYWYYRSLIEAGEESLEALAKTHAELGGVANIGVLRGDGQFDIYASHPENLVYTFELGSMKVACTSLHSHDDFLFQTIFPEARSVERVRKNQAKVL